MYPAGTDNCGYCLNKIGSTHKFITCALCKLKIHIKCNNIERNSYDKMLNDKQVSMCVKCNTENLPFYLGSKSSNDESFNKELLVSDIIKMYFKGINDLNNQHINGFDKNEDDFDITPIIDCKYVDLNSFRVFEDKNKFSLLHLNFASLSLHKEELENVLTMLNFKFDVIGITETKIKKDIVPDYDVSIKGYQRFFTPTESNKGGIILYIAEQHKCKPRKDLDAISYKTYALESVFTEIIIPNKRNILLGCMYRHPSMEVKDFNENYLNLLMDKLGDKQCFPSRRLQY